MDELLTHPAVQGGVAPFLVAFFFFAAFGKFRFVAGLGVIAAFLTTVAMVVGFSFDPLTSTRKIILLGMAGAALGLSLDFVKLPVVARSILLVALVAGAMIWVAWPVLAREELIKDMVLRAAMFGAFSGWVAVVLDFGRRRDAMAVSAAVAGLGLGAGGAAVIGASALLGQFAMAVGAAGMAALLSNVIRHRGEGSATLAITAGVLIGLIGPASILYAKVPLGALMALAVVPLVAYLPLTGIRQLWLRAGVWFLAAMVPAGVAIWISYDSAGPVPL